MKVNKAREIIEQLDKASKLLGMFDEDESLLEISEKYCIPEARRLLIDYRGVLQKAIDTAQLKLLKGV